MASVNTVRGRTTAIRRLLVCAWLHRSLQDRQRKLYSEVVLHSEVVKVPADKSVKGRRGRYGIA